MYINPFAAGIITTILVELVLIIVYTIYLNSKKK